MENEFNFDKLSNFCKRKGILYPTCEIYGGLSGFYEYGHIGFLIKKKMIEEWRKYFLKLNRNYVEIDGSSIMSEKVFKASGHLSNFFDPIVKIKDSDLTFRADKLIEEKLDIRAEEKSNEEMLEIIKENKLLGKDIDYSKTYIENLNLMFDINIGPTKGVKAYLRPESAQTPYVNFKNQYELQRKKMPLGIACVGKVYRNEISPRQLFLRTREVEQSELQIFFNPDKINESEFVDKNLDYKLKVLLNKNRGESEKAEFVTVEELLKILPKFYLENMVHVQKYYFDVLKINQDNFRFLELNEKEKAFYNKYHFDIEYKFRSLDSYVEVGGVHYRTDHDLKGHQKVSKQNLEVLDEETKTKYLPHVLELSLGIGRNFLTLLDNNLESIKENVLSIPNKFSPYSIGIFPLMKKEELKNKANEICDLLDENEIDYLYDEVGSIGKRYSRADEIGIPNCLCIDFESIGQSEDKSLENTFTIRNRDSTNQIRVSKDELVNTLKELIKK